MFRGLILHFEGIRYISKEDNSAQEIVCLTFHVVLLLMERMNSHWKEIRPSESSTNFRRDSNTREASSCFCQRMAANSVMYTHFP